MRNIISVCVAMILLVVIAVAPAVAADQSFSASDIESGNANPSVSIKNTGDFVNLCTPIQQVANTGNVVNQQGVLQANEQDAVNDQYAESDQDAANEAGDISFEGSSIEVSPTFEASCDQSITVT